MAINKVDFGGKTLIDLTADTVTAADLRQGVTAHDKAGNAIIGTYTPSASGGVQMASGRVDGYKDGPFEISGLTFRPVAVIIRCKCEKSRKTNNVYVAAVDDPGAINNTQVIKQITTSWDDLCYDTKPDNVLFKDDGCTFTELITKPSSSVTVDDIVWWAFSGL